MKFWCDRYFLALVGFLTAIGLSVQKRDFYFSIDECEIESFQSELVQVNCSMGNLNNGWPLSVYITSFIDFDTYGIAFNISLKPPGRSFFHLFSKKIVNVCPYMETGKRPMDLAFLLIDEIKSQGHVPKCPADKGTYYINNFQLSPDLFPPYVPEGTFFVDGTYHAFQKKKLYDPLIRYRVTGNIKLHRNPFQFMPVLVKKDPRQAKA